MTAIKAVIFDMDGVLIDAKDWHYEALNKALSPFGQEISRYDHLVTFDGLPTKKKLAMLSLESGFPGGLHGLVNQLKQEFTVEMIHTRCKPHFPHQFALARLSNEGMRLAVCSNSIRRSVELMMEKSALLGCLEFFLSNEDVSKSKPDPEMYLTAFSRLNLKPQECLILEDNENGIKAAKASGGHVMEIGTIDDVNYDNIKRHLARICQG